MSLMISVIYFFIMRFMQKSETVFWSIVFAASMYLVTDFVIGLKANAQGRPVVANQVAPMQGMGCMAKGGGCGCGGMMKKQ